MIPYSPIPRFVRGENHHGLIRRLIRPDVDADVSRIDLITTTFLRLSLLDTGSAPTEVMAEGDTVLQVLWQAYEPDAYVDVSGDRLPIAPGDSVAIPSGDTWLVSANQLLVSISRRESKLAVPLGPMHGPDEYVGHNRVTTPEKMGIARWKLTEPLKMPASETDTILIGLHNDIAIQSQSGISMLNRGEASVIRPDVGQITLVPNGLSYVLMIS